MNGPELRVGDWVVVMNANLVPSEYDSSTYEALPAVVTGFDGDIVNLESPIKVCWGKIPLDKAPRCQLIRVSEEEALRYVAMIKASYTYESVRRDA